MNDIMTIAKTSTKGSFFLFLGVALSNIISALGVVVLVNVLTPGDYGLYSIAFYPPALMALFRDWGMNSAMVKYIAQHRKEKKPGNVRSVLVCGTIFELTLGAILSLVTFLLAGFLATSILNRPKIQPLIQMASVTVLFGGLLSAAQSAFLGFERMKFNSYVMICRSVVKSSLSPLLVLLGLGTLGAVMGNAISFITGGTLGLVILFIFFYRRLKDSEKIGITGSGVLRTMWKYGLPLSFSAILAGFLAQLYVFMMARYCSDALIGNYQAAVNFSVVLTFLAIPISSVLFPAFSKLDSRKEIEMLRTVFRSSVRYGALIIIPATLALMTLSYSLVNILFGNKYAYAPYFLILYAIGFLFSALGSHSVGNFINGQGATMLTLKLTLVTTAFGALLALILIPQFGIVGVIVGSFLAGVPSLVLGLWWIRRNYSVTIDWLSSLKILAGSGLSAGTTFAFLYFTGGLNEWIRVLGGAALYLFVYLITVPLVGAVNETDLKNLKEMTSGLGPVSKIASAVLALIRTILLWRY